MTKKKPKPKTQLLRWSDYVPASDVTDPLGLGLRGSTRLAKRELVHRHKVIRRICDWCELATSGRDTEKEFFDGYLFSLWDNLGGDEELLQKVCAEHALCAELVAMLLIAQKLRYVPGETPQYGKPPKSHKDVLTRQAEIITNGIAECGLEEPTKKEVQEALERYQMFSPDEVSEILAAL